MGIAWFIAIAGYSLTDGLTERRRAVPGLRPAPVSALSQLSRM